MSRTFSKYNPHGVLALRPDAFGMMFLCDAEDRSNVYTSDCAVVKVSGPLMATADSWFDSYQAIRERFAEACLSPAKRIILHVNSPGGMVHEAFVTARELRDTAAAAGKEYWAFIDEMGYSAGYALASSAQRIAISETGGAGSVGVIKTRVDLSKMNDQMGLGVTFITSGAKKAFGNPDLAISPEEIADEQREVDQYAAMFFTLVSEHRGLSVDQVKGFEAGTFIGAGAVQAGLADQVGRLADLLIAPSITGAQVSITEVIEALNAIAASDGEDKDKAAKMLAALAPEEDEQAEGSEATSEGSEASAEVTSEDAPSDEEESAPSDEDPEEEEQAAASADATEIQALKAEVAKLTELVNAKASKPVITTVKPTVTTKAPEKSKLDRELDKAFGLDKSNTPTVSREGNAIVFR